MSHNKGQLLNSYIYDMLLIAAFVFISVPPCCSMMYLQWGQIDDGLMPQPPVCGQKCNHCCGRYYILYTLFIWPRCRVLHSSGPISVLICCKFGPVCPPASAIVPAAGQIKGQFPTSMFASPSRRFQTEFFKIGTFSSGSL